jgi:hypothetical protein
MAYALLSRVMPPWAAVLLTGVWFAALVWAVFFAIVADGANFRYWRM